MAVAELRLLSEEALDLLVSRIDEVSSLPAICLQTIDVANDPDGDAELMTKVVETDIALSARVMKEVNSSAAGLTTKASNLQQGIALLGMKAVRNLAIASNVCDLFQGGEEINKYSRSGLWKHMVAVGIGARIYSNKNNMADPEDAFLAGLLHDMGIVILDQKLHKRFTIMLDEMKPEQAQIKWEKEYFGYDHTEIGFRVAQRWGLPKPITEVIRDHHRGRMYGGSFGELMKCVEIANMAATDVGLSSLGEKYGKTSKSALDAFDMTPGELTIFGKEISATLEKHQNWLGE
ncbi:MAG: hypothetical protein COA78_37820 [Blastopirellula sp.]|nr:MAG: hypothetical protein COA78_37820 [Blastopirellula sp.]